MAEPMLTFDFFGAQMAVSAAPAQLLDGMRKAFPLFIGTGAGPDAFTLNIIEAVHASPTPDMPLTWEGKLPDGRPGKVWESSGTAILEVEESVVITIDHASRRADVQVAPGKQAAFLSSALMFILDAALVAGGQQLLHGACLVEQASQRAALICVPSGGGKTTTSLALAHDGFTLMTDDASVLMPRAGQPRIWGLPRPLKVHRFTAELMPWVGPLTDKWDENGEQGIALSDISDRIGVMAPQPVELGAIFLLGPRSSSGHAVTPLSKAEMLVGIAHDNVAFRAAGMTPRALHRFGLIGRMVADVPTFQISAGRDLPSLPALIAAAMNQNTVTVSRS